MEWIRPRAFEQILQAWSICHCGSLRNRCSSTIFWVPLILPHLYSWVEGKKIVLQRKRGKFIPIISKTIATIHCAFTICLAQCLLSRAIYERFNVAEQLDYITYLVFKAVGWSAKNERNFSVSLPMKELRHGVLGPRFLLSSGKSQMAFIYKGLNHKWKPRDLSFCFIWPKNVSGEFELEAHI